MFVCRTLVSDMHMSASNENVEHTTSGSPAGGTQTTKAVRRTSFRDSILAEANREEHGAGAGGGGEKPARRGSVSGGESPSDVKRQLLVERSNYEKLMVQMLVLTNDLNEREDQIIAMKKREAAFEEQLASKEKMYEQDAKVRMQLGKRLEDVLMDKEEIKDELDNLKVIHFSGLCLPDTHFSFSAPPVNCCHPIRPPAVYCYLSSFFTSDFLLYVCVHRVGATRDDSKWLEIENESRNCCSN